MRPPDFLSDYKKKPFFGHRHGSIYDRWRIDAELDAICPPEILTPICFYCKYKIPAAALHCQKYIDQEIPREVLYARPEATCPEFEPEEGTEQTQDGRDPS